MSSRVCTPAPEAADPFLGGLPPTPTTTGAPAFHHLGGGSLTSPQQQQQQQASPENLVVVKMGVEELRALITDVVQKAVEGLRAAENEKAKSAAVDVDVDVDASVGLDGVGEAVVPDKGLGFQHEEEVNGDEIVVAGSFTAAENHDNGFSPMKEE